MSISNGHSLARATHRDTYNAYRTNAEQLADIRIARDLESRRIVSWRDDDGLFHTIIPTTFTRPFKVAQRATRLLIHHGHGHGPMPLVTFVAEQEDGYHYKEAPCS